MHLGLLDSSCEQELTCIQKIDEENFKMLKFLCAQPLRKLSQHEHSDASLDPLDWLAFIPITSSLEV